MFFLPFTTKINHLQQFNRDIYQQEGNNLGLTFAKKLMEIICSGLTIMSGENEFATVVANISLTSKTEIKKYSTKD